MARINQLESENFDLKDKMDELTDKELHCVGVQTMSTLKAESGTMTDKQPEAPIAVPKLSQEVGVNTTIVPPINNIAAMENNKKYQVAT